MEITFDKGVNLTGVKTEILFGMTVVKGICENYGVAGIRVTSVVRPKGKSKSYHPDGLAVDFKLKLKWQPFLKNEKVCYGLLKMFKNALDEQFDIVYHGDSDGDGKHFHMEFDPK